MEVPAFDFPAMFREVTNGNAHAYAFCESFAHWVHLIDDVIDRDKPPPDPEYVLLVGVELLRTLAGNPFWQEHKRALMPLVIQSAQAFLDANRWAGRPNFRDRATSDVLKSQYQEVFLHVAFLCGGYNHLDRMAQKYRTYDYEAQG